MHCDLFRKLGCFSVPIIDLVSSDKRHVFLISIGKLHVLITLLLYYLADQNPEIDEIGSDLLDSRGHEDSYLSQLTSIAPRLQIHPQQLDIQYTNHFLALPFPTSPTCNSS